MKPTVQLPRGVKSITVLSAETVAPRATAAATAIVDDGASPRKKQSRGLKGLEKWARRNAEAQQVFADTYLGRHGRSNEKRRDGWLKDLAYNVLRANRQATKKLSIVKLFGW